MRQLRQAPDTEVRACVNRRLFLTAPVLLLAGCPGATDRAERSELEGAAAKPTDVERRIFDAVNRERKQRGRDALSWSGTLLKPARSHSRRMAEAGFFAHEDPKLGNLPERLRRHGIRVRAAGENLFVSRGLGDPVEIAVKGWLESPSHREIMLSGQFRESAVGVVRTGQRVYATQIFSS